MSRPRINTPLAPEDALLIAELDAMPTEQRDRLLGTLVSLIFAIANEDDNSVKFIYEQLRSEDDLDIERINLLRIAASVRLSRFGIDRHLGANMQVAEPSELNEKISNNAEVEIIVTMEELVTKYIETEDEDRRNTILDLIVKLTEYSRHLEVSKDTWLHICELQEPYEAIVSKTLAAKLPPKSLWSEFGIAA